MTKTINKNLINVLAIIALFSFNVVLLTPKDVSANHYSPVYAYNEPEEIDHDDYDYDENDYYEDLLNARPAISSIDPQVANKNSNAINVTVVGSNFNTDSIVQWDGANLPTRYETSKKLIAQLPSSKLDTNGSYEIKVFNDNSNKSSNSATFVVRDRLVTSATVAGTTSGTSNSSGNTASTVKKTTTSKSSTATTTSKSSTAKDSESKNSGSELAGNALFGAGNGFLPSNILQWIIFAILILLAVILWRKLWVTEEDKRAPLKHA